MGLNYALQAAGPLSKALAVTPSNTVDLAATADALYIGVTGDVALILADDSAAVTFVGAVAGSILRLKVKRVLVTGTAATDIVALYA